MRPGSCGGQGQIGDELLSRVAERVRPHRADWQSPPRAAATARSAMAFLDHRTTGPAAPPGPRASPPGRPVSRSVSATSSPPAIA
jgi:hypothetical protein